MAAAAMENYDPAFASMSEAGDIIVSGLNFGTGSSREQAATCLKIRGIACVVAESYSQTYVRNAINNGFLCLTSPGLVAHLRQAWADHEGLTIVAGLATIDFQASAITLEGVAFPFAPLGEVPQEIILAGGAENVVRARLA